MVWYSHLFQNFLQFIGIHTVKGFGIGNKAEVDVFLELSCFFHDPADVGHLISGSSAFSKTSLNIGEFTVHVLQEMGSVSGKTGSPMLFFLAPIFLADFSSGTWVLTKLANFAWASKVKPGRPQCLLSFQRTERRLWPT